MTSALFVDGLSATRIAEIEARLRDPNFSSSGFLGRSESLVERVHADAATLRELGITHDQIADRLESLVAEAERLRDEMRSAPGYQSAVSRYCQSKFDAKGDVSADDVDFEQMERLEDEEKAMLVHGRFRCREYGYKGYQYCPFCVDADGETGHSCAKASCDFSIENVRTGRAIGFSELMPHLIRDHQFFEGVGLPYRLEPALAVETLELRPLA